MLHFLHALDEHHNGNCIVVLYDNVGRGASKDFGTQPTAEWEGKTFMAGPGTGWNEDAGFDWTKVKQFRVDCWEKSGEAGSFWIDQPYFSYEVVKPNLRILSSPTGKHYTINGTSGYTPAVYGLDSGSTYTVEMDADLFKQWENGSTNPIREISITDDTTITAYYEGGGQPGPGIEDVAIVLGAVSSVFAIVGVIYSVWAFYTGG